MGWQQREATSGNKAVTIGDNEKKGQIPKAGGLLLNIILDQRFKNLRYQLQQRDGSTLEVRGSSSIDRSLSETDIGRLVVLTFKGRERSQGGSEYKAIDVQVWDGRPQDSHFKMFPELKHFWPDGAESPQVSKELLRHAAEAREDAAKFEELKRNDKGGTRGAGGSKGAADFSDFPEALDEEDDDLPF